MRHLATHFFAAIILCLSGSVASQAPTQLLLQPIDEPVVAEVPVLLAANLVASSGIPIVGQSVVFEVFEDGWQIVDDGLTITDTVTDQETGIAEVYFVPGRSSLAEFRVTFAGSDLWEPADTTFALSIQLSPASFQNLEGYTHTKGNGIPLILVHGRSGSGEFDRWDTYLNYLAENADQLPEFDVYVWDHDTRKPIGFSGDAGSALDLYESLAGLSTSYQEFTPAFIAHSRGGLVVRSLMSRQVPDGSLYGEKVLGLITLGTPHRGTPLAVTDWSAAIWQGAWGNFPGGESFFKLLVGVEGLLFETDLIGDLNLSWDNYDGAVPETGYRSKELDSEAPNHVDLSPADLNVEADSNNDLTAYYSQPFKARFGTLSQINQGSAIPFADRIVTIGAYRGEPTNLLRNAIAAVQIVLSLPVSTDVREWLDIRLDDGDRDHNLLNMGNRLLAHSLPDLFTDAPDINYDANDGLVPLQSALLLGPSSGNVTDPSVTREIKIDRDVLSASRQVKAHHVFSTVDGIEDHLDLLITDNRTYWNTITQEVRQFLPDAARTACAPDLNASAFIDFADFLIFADLFRTQDLRADFNVDGLTDFNDFLIFASRFNQPCP